MANEISISAGIKLKNGNLAFSSSPTSFQANQSVANGPSPGAVKALTSGTTVSFAELTLPGWAAITNTDASNFVTYGLFDGSTFRPLGELRPGETAVLRFSRTMLTANAAADVFRLVADTATVIVLVNCLDA